MCIYVYIYMYIYIYIYSVAILAQDGLNPGSVTQFVLHSPSQPLPPSCVSRRSVLPQFEQRSQQ